MPRVFGWFCLSAVVIGFDYLTKAAMLRAFARGESRPVTEFFNLVLVFNKGAAFSFLAWAQGWQTFAFAAIAIVASVVIVFLIFRNVNKTLFCTGLSLILGGALGNLYDRLVYGHVVDFLDFYIPGASLPHWPAFNLADSAITVGAGILILESFLHREPESREKSA